MIDYKHSNNPEDDLINGENIEDLYLEHQFHDTPMSDCSLCYDEELAEDLKEIVDLKGFYNYDS